MISFLRASSRANLSPYHVVIRTLITTENIVESAPEKKVHKKEPCHQVNHQIQRYQLQECQHLVNNSLIMILLLMEVE